MNLKIIKGTTWIVGGALAFGVVIQEDRNEHIEQREFQETPQMSFEINNSTVSFNQVNLFVPEVSAWLATKK
jgi:hypothetical protein